MGQQRGNLPNLDDDMAAIMRETRKRVEAIHGKRPEREPVDYDDDFDLVASEEEFDDDDDDQVARELGVTPTPRETPARPVKGRRVQASVRPPSKPGVASERAARLRQRSQGVQFRYDGSNLTIVRGGKPLIRLGADEVDNLLEALGG